MQRGTNPCRRWGGALSACLRACDTAEKIRTRLAVPYAVDGSTITVPASIGTAVYPVDGHDYGALIKQSDIAMYRAKTLSSATELA
jgi:GGDEF domain-containing protein